MHHSTLQVLRELRAALRHPAAAAEDLPGPDLSLAVAQPGHRARKPLPAPPVACSLHLLPHALDNERPTPSCAPALTSLLTLAGQHAHCAQLGRQAQGPRLVPQRARHRPGAPGLPDQLSKQEVQHWHPLRSQAGYVVVVAHPPVVVAHTCSLPFTNSRR